MDSSAVGELAGAYTSATARRARVALVGLQPKVKQLLGVMCFLDHFQQFDSTIDALQIMRALPPLKTPGTMNQNP